VLGERLGPLGAACGDAHVVPCAFSQRANSSGETTRTLNDMCAW